MYFVEALSVCAFLSLILSSAYCQSDDDSVFKDIYITWVSEESEDRYSIQKARARNLRDAVPEGANTWGLFSASVSFPRDNEIQQLKKESVTDIKNLTILCFTGCGIREIQPGALRNLPQLTNFDLASNKLTEIKSNTFADLTITYLNLKHNNISVLQPAAFHHLPNLEQLLLEGNSLRRFPAGLFDAGSNMKQLSLRSNGLLQIELEAFKNIPHLTELELGFNGLTDFKCNMFKFPKLTKLNLIANSILLLPSGCFKNMLLLRLVNFGSNKLSEIPEGVFNYSKIKELNLGANRISQIASNAFDIPTLQYLRIDKNKLTVWNSRWFQFTPQLKRLSVWANQIEALPDEAFNYCSYIRFSKNRIGTVSEGAFRNLKHINHLDLADNKIEKWSDKLLSNITVRYVSLRNNKLQCIDGDLERVFGGAAHVVLDDNPWRPDCQLKIVEFNATHRRICEEIVF